MRCVEVCAAVLELCAPPGISLTCASTPVVPRCSTRGAGVTRYFTVQAFVLEIGTAEPVSLISNMC